jgi:hypothetical protein
MSAQNKPSRDVRGRLLPGSTANPNGRPKGSLNNTTKEAMRRAQADAAKRYEQLSAIADDPRVEIHLRAQVASRLLDLGRSAPEDIVEPATEWMSERKLKLFLRLLREATLLRDSGAPKALRSVEPRVPFTGIPAAATVVDAEVISTGEVRIPIKEQA